jgi:hypothetical protein
MLPNTVVASLATRMTGFITGWLRPKKPSRLSNRASVSKSTAIRKTTPRETLEALGIILELTEREASAEEIKLCGKSVRPADIGVSIHERSFSVYRPLVEAVLDDLKDTSYCVEQEDVENATDPIDMSRRALERALLQRLGQ